MNNFKFIKWNIESGGEWQYEGVTYVYIRILQRVSIFHNMVMMNISRKEIEDEKWKNIRS